MEEKIPRTDPIPIYSTPSTMPIKYGIIASFTFMIELNSHIRAKLMSKIHVVVTKR